MGISIGCCTVSTGTGPKSVEVSLESLFGDQLTGALFKPLKKVSLKHLTFKTVYLLTLGSGKRRSEIYAWVIRHQSDWSKVSLCPSPSFLSKNQLVQEGPESVAPVVILVLAPTLDKSLKEDRPLCPVRVKVGSKKGLCPKGRI